MHRIYGAFIEIIAASIFIIPLFCLYGKLSVNNLKRTFIYIVFGFYLVAVLALVGFQYNIYEFGLYNQYYSIC